ncbi:related to Ankyrin repeat-containing protein YCR051W [Saccharomycodes ludwigii]|uniref:Related to Ankyrin repeat-containing protein YCR051W n=1 Tax=Saccharomycodes ludwigii TaxID=36035 RepID=A0A376B7F5_9ASCO|nr:related to Ankyrin repeat-containing protein YCR051W [Saccharomycodes ludwigii]
MNIWIAASDGKTDLVEKYIKEQGFTANCKDPNGYTPLHAAASYGHRTLLAKLVKEFGGDINIKDEDGDTPLHHVEDVITARYMVEELDANYNLKNNEGQTPLETFESDVDSSPELVQYMKSLGNTEGVTGSDNGNFLDGIDAEQYEQYKENLKYTLSTEIPQDEESLARQRRVQEIMNGDNVDEELEKYVRDLIHQQLFTGADNAESEPSMKRRK